MANHRAADDPTSRRPVVGSSERAPRHSGPTTAVPTPTHPPTPVTTHPPVPAPTHPPAPGAARRSSPDDLAARALTTVIPASPAARRPAAGSPVFVDGSGRRARRLKGVAVGVAALAAAYVGVVVTGAVSGPSGPVGGTTLPVANGASLAPSTPPVPAAVPAPAVAPAPTAVRTPTPTTTAKRTTPRRTTAKRTTPRVVPAPAAPVPVAPAPAPAAPAAPAPAPADPGAGGGDDGGGVAPNGAAVAPTDA